VRLAQLCVAACLMMGAPLVTQPLGWDVPEQRALGILLAAAFLWATEAVPLFLTGLGVLAVATLWLLPALHGAGIDASYATLSAPFFSEVILLFLGGFTLSAAFQDRGIDERLARRVLARSDGTVASISAAIVLLSGVLSMWLSNTATAAMMLGVVLPMVHRLEKSDPGRKALLLSVPIGANLGGLATPVGSPPNAIALTFFAQAPSFAQWILLALPATVVLLWIGWWLLHIVFPSSATLETPTASMEPLPRGAATTLLVAATTVLGWLTENQHGVSTGLIALVPVFWFFGSGTLGRRQLLALPWDVLLMMGGGMALGNLVQVSGLADQLVNLLPTSGPIVLVGMLIAAVVMSSLMSNTATANLLLPLAATTAGATNGTLIGIVALGCSVAMALPISTPPNAMAYASGELSSRDVLKIGVPMTLIGAFSIWLSSVLWWPIWGIR